MKDQNDISQSNNSNQDMVSRLSVEKLEEEMNFEKAMNLLRVPKMRCTNTFNDKILLDKCFMSYFRHRYKISENNPLYQEKAEKRHVLELLLHEAYQFLSRTITWKNR
ncbi:unnamed protein product [Lepeophtheirus salmonis]|uniref:(salmon louse) hypothetical protein n=1 Tax=Lepeophtheirus salmonis TaxID=72036 RepID=A0A7R8H7I0_LEPSM|nr:unnamed protein product [Lepeophtheirus salmonis]CAF2921147.1 unnamed protein product [Lepeophtheirus salmonis]